VPKQSLLSNLSEVIAATAIPMPHGNPDAILDGISEERLRLQYESALAYLRGDFERVKNCYQKTEGDGAAKLRAASIAIAAAISMGDYPFYTEIETYLKRIIEANISCDVTAFAEMTLSTAYTGAIAPDMVSDWLKDGDFSNLMPHAKLDAAYKRAKYFQCTGQFEAMLTTAQTTFELCASASGIAFLDIYFRVACVIACVALGRMDEAKRRLSEALAICLPHGFISPFAESATAFGGLLEKCLEQEYPEHYGAVTKQWQRTFTNWMVFHNQFTKDNISLILTMREYQMAQLAAHSVPFKKIAEQFHISVGTLNNNMQIIYQKLFINGKGELSQYVL